MKRKQSNEKDDEINEAKNIFSRNSLNSTVSVDQHMRATLFSSFCKNLNPCKLKTLSSFLTFYFFYKFRNNFRCVYFIKSYNLRELYFVFLMGNFYLLNLFLIL